MVSEMIGRLTKNLVPHEPPSKGLRFAAVSIIVRDPQFPSVLLIRRAERAGDPWSGQIAFPGGKMQPEDRSARDTAVRETMEEVGINLNRGTEFLGYGATTTTHTGTMDVVPAVFFLKEGVEIRTNQEVASYRWVDLEKFVAPEAKATYPLVRDGNAVELPAFKVEDYLVWGLTHRIITSVLSDDAGR